MNASTSRPVIKTGSDADLAFVLVVLASYFATFSALHEARAIEIVLMIGLGTAYILLGIYGYAFCARRPEVGVSLVYFAIQIFLGGWIVYLGKGAGFNALILLPLAGHSVVLLSGRWMYFVNTVIVAAYVGAVRYFSGGWDQVARDLPTFVAGLIFIMVFTQMAVNEEKARTDVERLAKNLEEANRQLSAYALQAEELAIVNERNRLAREIHDGLGHYLTTVHMQIQAARAVMDKDPQQAKAVLERAQSQTSEALIDVRRSVAALRSAPEADMALPEAIGKLMQNCESLGMKVSISLLGEGRILPSPVHQALYRVAQEGINNICKHSQARQVWITLDYCKMDCVRLVVKDDGVGQDGAALSGFGLLGVRERIQALGGETQYQSLPGQGFTLEVCVPT